MLNYSESLMTNANEIDNELKQLLSQFDHIDLTQRLDLSTTVFDQLRLFFERYKLTQVNQTMTDNRFQLFEDTHQHTMDIYERMIMLHVEEIDYKDRLVQLQEVFTVFTGEPFREYLEQVQSNLSQQQQDELTKQFTAAKAA